MRTLGYFASTVLTMLVHTLCCGLPLLTALLGVGGYVSALGWVSQYRWPLAALQALLLVWSGYKLYAGRATSARLRTERAFFWGLVMLSAILTVLPHEWLKTEQQVLATAQVQRAFATRQLTLAVQTAQEAAVQQQLRRVSGVVNAEPQPDSNNLTVRYNIQKISKDRLLTTLRQKGYEVQEVLN